MLVMVHEIVSGFAGSLHLHASRRQGLPAALQALAWFLIQPSPKLFGRPPNIVRRTLVPQWQSGNVKIGGAEQTKTHILRGSSGMWRNGFG